MALHRYGDFRVEVFYFDSPCIPHEYRTYNIRHLSYELSTTGSNASPQVIFRRTMMVSITTTTTSTTAEVISLAPNVWNSLPIDQYD